MGQAVRDASQLPEADRRKKLNALRLKWHPDKHEMLREMAEEVRTSTNSTNGPRQLISSSAYQLISSSPYRLVSS